MFLLEETHRNHSSEFIMPARYYRQIKIITTVLSQQQEILDTGKSVPDHIVSPSKSYIGPISRGKKVKLVEFRANVNMSQFVKGNFIGQISFTAFHEGIRLKQSVRYGRELVGKLRLLSGDDIHATNANRTYCKKENITHGFN